MAALKPTSNNQIASQLSVNSYNQVAALKPTSNNQIASQLSVNSYNQVAALKPTSNNQIASQLSVNRYNQVAAIWSMVTYNKGAALISTTFLKPLSLAFVFAT